MDTSSLSFETQKDLGADDKNIRHSVNIRQICVTLMVAISAPDSAPAAATNLRQGFGWQANS